MGSYHSSFTYLNKNSSGEGFIIASFEPDSGFVDTYLGMDQITTNSFDGTKKYFYGNKYNTSAEILITLVKLDGTDFSMSDNRRVLRWLTGNRQASWLDFYVDDKLVYSFYGNVTACQQQKLDARVVGVQITFTSIHPWAWSPPQSFNCYIGEKIIDVDDSGAIYKSYDDKMYFGITDDGVLYNNSDNNSFLFSTTDDGVVHTDSSVSLVIDNQSDDLYTLTNLDIKFSNINSTSLVIKNLTLGETETRIENIAPQEVINLNSGQFIISETFPNKIFGDDFSFVWPKLRPGANLIFIDGTGKGYVTFTYRYPIKIGDCAIDIEELGKNPMFEGDISGVVGSVDGITTLARKNVVLNDNTTNKAYVASVQDSYLHINASDSNLNNRVVLKANDTNQLYEIVATNNSFYLSGVSTINDNTSVRERIVLIDATTNKPYELKVKENMSNNLPNQDYSLYLSKI